MSLSTEKLLQNLEVQLLKASKRSKPDEVVEILADEFLEFGSSGRIFNKQQVIESLSMELPSERTLENFKALQLSSDVFLVTYKVVLFEPKQAKRRYSLRSSIWKCFDGVWKLVFHQGTACEESI